MSDASLIAVGPDGKSAQFPIFEAERQYSIGRHADISLGDLETEGTPDRNGMYATSGYLTFIDGAWYFRAARGNRRGRRAVLVNGAKVDSSRAELRVRHGHTISFGESEPVVVTFVELQPFETLKDRKPEFTGLFDTVKLEFENLNDGLRARYALGIKANTGEILAKLEGEGLFNASFEYNMARGMRNIIAHPSEGVAESIRRDYVHQSIEAIRSVQAAVSGLTAPLPPGAA